MTEREDAVHLWGDEGAHGELAAEPPREFANEHVADDYAVRARFEMMFVAKAREGAMGELLAFSSLVCD